MTHTIVRTQRPVGQGCFFTEEHSFHTGAGFHLVYDCGSVGSAQALRTQIGRFAAESTGRDGLLVVSHFHADHISGLRMLIDQGVRFRRVFVPGLTPDEAQVVLLDAAADLGRTAIGSDAERHLATAWELLIGGGEGLGGIVRVIPEGTDAVDDLPDDGEPAPGSVHPHWRNVIPHPLLAGTRWRLRFYCHIDKPTIARLRASLVGDLEKAFASDFAGFMAWLRTNKGILAKYRTALGLTRTQTKWDNLVSLCCYSGPAGHDAYESRVQTGFFQCGPAAPDWPYLAFPWRHEAGWLGTGDIPLRNTRSGGISCWLPFKSHFAREMPSVAFATVPHHGSADDHERELYQPGMVVTVAFGASVGPRQYGHPGHAVLADICKRGAIPALVTEDPDSAFSAWTVSA